MLPRDYYLERADKTLIIGKTLSLYGILVIGVITIIEANVYHSIEFILCRLLFITPASLFLLLSIKKFKTNMNLVIPFHTLTLVGGVLMMVGITLIKFQMKDIPIAFKVATVSGGLVTAIFIMFVFSAGARKYYTYTISILLVVFLVIFALENNLTWLDFSPFVNPLISGLGIIVISIIMEKLQYQDFKMKKIIEAKNERLKSEIKQRKEIEAKLREQVMVDDLTGAFNRRASYKLLEECLNKSRENEEEFIVCFIDLDNLKLINDSYGHSEGDQLIITFANILKKVVRENDYVCRVGGDEFLLILRDCSVKDADVIIERIKNILGDNTKYTEIDFSYGFSEFRLDNELDIEQLIAYADKNMYKNKIEKKKAF